MGWIGLILMVLGGVGALILGMVAMVMREDPEAVAAATPARNFTA